MKRKYDVFGTKVTVKKVDLSNQDFVGLYHLKKQEILLDKTLSKEEMFQTFLHEIIHAIWQNTGLNQTMTSLDVQELVCENVSKWIVKNFKLTDK